MGKTNIVIVGAGVTGLTTGLLLAKDPRYSITIIAKHMPGDYDIEYCSPWAGADYAPFAEAGTREARWEAETWPDLARLASDVPEAGVHFQKERTYLRDKDGKGLTGALKTTEPWFKDVVPDFRVLCKEECPPGHNSGTEFTSVCINTALYLPYLMGQCRKAGVLVKRSIISHIAQASSLHHSGGKAHIVINCTGLSSCILGGVEDKTMQPARGQTVLVRNDSALLAGTSGTDDGPDERTYFMSRASGGGTILGGSYQLGNWESQPDLNLAQRIMQRSVEIHPQLGDGKGVRGLSVVRHAVGLRPWRRDGVRLERELMGGVFVVHNYGHAGYGYQTSYSCARDVVSIVEGIVREGKAKL